MISPRLFSFLAAVPVLLLTACQEPDSAASPESSESASSEGKPVVYVPVAPYQTVFQRLAGDLLDIRVIVGPEEDPHSYTPTPQQVAQMAKSNLLCSGELGFEGNYFVVAGDGVSGPKELNLLAGLDLLEGICDHPSHKTETTEDDHDHSHEDLNDPHVWLSPTTLQVQSTAIAAHLKQLVAKEDRAEIDANLESFVAELGQLDKELQTVLTPHKGTKFYVYHGAFAYFARDYGVEQVAIEIGNRKPTPKQLAEISTQATEDGVEIIFVQPQFDQSSAKALAEAIGGKVAVINPLEADIFSNLRSVAKAIADQAGK